MHEGRITSSSPNRKYRKRFLKLFPCIDLIQTSLLAVAIGDLLIGALLLLSSADLTLRRSSDNFVSQCVCLPVSVFVSCAGQGLGPARGGEGRADAGREILRPLP